MANIKNTPKINKSTYELFDQYLLAMLRSRLDKTDQTLEIPDKLLGEDNVCVICFDDLTKEDLT